MSKNVYIVGGYDGMYGDMMEEAGWKLVSFDNKLNPPTLCLFTGGEDVSPCLYGEEKHPHTFSSRNRDEKEAFIFQTALRRNIPMVGICRGGQFLNVMSGGSMYQHVNNHAIRGEHGAYYHDLATMFAVTSTHHQMMRPSEDGIVLVTSEPMATFREYVANGEVVQDTSSSPEVESVFYPHTKALCFQPHPEFKHGSCRELFFTLLKNTIGM